MAGFSTLQFYPFRGHRIVYSGDTIVHPAHWKQQTLHGAWLRRIALLRSEYPGERVFWFLLVKGVRTYRYMSTLAQTFYPHWNGNVKEPELARLAAELAKDKFGSLYNPARGVVECPSAFGYLNRTMATVTDAQRSKPDVAFFLHKTRTMSAAMNWSACVKSLLIMWLNVISHCLKNPMLSSAMDNARSISVPGCHLLRRRALCAKDSSAGYPPVWPQMRRVNTGSGIIFPL